MQKQNNVKYSIEIIHAQFYILKLPSKHNCKTALEFCSSFKSFFIAWKKKVLKLNWISHLCSCFIIPHPHHHHHHRRMRKLANGVVLRFFTGENIFLANLYFFNLDKILHFISLSHMSYMIIYVRSVIHDHICHICRI